MVRAETVAVPAVALGLFAAIVVHIVQRLDGGVQAAILAVPLGAIGGLLAIRRFDLFVVVLVIVRPMLDVFDTGALGGTLDPAAGVGAVFVATSVLWLGAQWSAGDLVRPQFATWSLITLAITGAASIVVSARPVMSAEATIRLLSGVLMFVVVEQLLRRRPEFAWWLVGAVLVSSVVPITVAATQVIAGVGISGLDGASRVFGTFVHPNPFATYLVTVCLLACTLSIARIGKWRLVAAGVMFASGATLLFTGARAAWMAVFVGLVYIGIRIARVMLLVVAGASAVAIVMVPSVLVRITDLTAERYTGDAPPNSLAWRVEYWREVLALGARRPLNGIGLEMSKFLTDDGLQPHSVPVQVFTELGVMGVITLAVAITAMAASLIGRRRAALTNADTALSVAAVAVMLGYAVQIPTENLLTQSIAWWVLAAASTYGLAPGLHRGPFGPAR